MSAHDLAQLLAVAATVVVNAGTVPQAWTVARRRGDCPGVSVPAAGLVAVGCAGWAAYSASAGLAVSAVSSLLGLVLWTAVAVPVAARRRPHELAAPAALAAALVAAWAVAGAPGLGAVLVASGVVTTVPQLWHLRRSTEGLSLTTWATSAAAAACWLVYAAVEHDAVLLVSQTFRALVCAAVVVTAAGLRRRDATPVPTAA